MKPGTMQVCLNTGSVADYQLFLRIKELPRFRIVGHVAEFPEEYADFLGIARPQRAAVKYVPIGGLFDYQRDIAALSIRKQKFAAFLSPGLGKTLIMLEFARHARNVLPRNRPVLIVSPLMVVRQTLSECERFYGDNLTIRQIRAKELPDFLISGEGIGITNYEAIVAGLPSDRIGALLLDESSLLKSHYGAWGQRLIEMGKGVAWKLCLTGTPAPNDRIEYGNHAVFLDQFPNVNAFLARYFINRGQTSERWELRPHALRPFYRSLSHWSIFMSDPAVYGWKDNVGTLPPINVNILDVDITEQQAAAVVKETGHLFPIAGGITSRGKLAQIAKGNHKGVKYETNKPEFIRNLVESFGDRSTIIWCKYNAEQDSLAALFPDCANIDGKTKEEKRVEFIADFQAGRRKILLSKAEIIGFGLNLQVCTRMVFSTCQDSYEDYTQCVHRANRVGSTEPLDVYLPVTELERPMMINVLRKAKMVENDTREQEQFFRENNYVFAS